MNSISRMVGEASLGLALGMGMAEPFVAPESNPAHVALIHGSKDAETPALPALAHVETNRAERRRLGLVGVDLNAVRQDELPGIYLQLDEVRQQITSHKNLIRKSRR
jgi:hypothetical protein